jgi:hypothetical protein
MIVAEDTFTFVLKIAGPFISIDEGNVKSIDRIPDPVEIEDPIKVDPPTSRSLPIESPANVAEP